jgi:hypothetical protein
MATLTLPEVFDLRLKIQELEGKVNSGELSLFEDATWKMKFLN